MIYIYPKQEIKHLVKIAQDDNTENAALKARIPNLENTSNLKLCIRTYKQVHSVTKST